MENFDYAKMANFEWAIFQLQNGDSLQIVYKWSIYEIVYVDFIHHPYEM